MKLELKSIGIHASPTSSCQPATEKLEGVFLEEKARRGSAGFAVDDEVRFLRVLRGLS
jgi:hypothetical protein